MTPPAGAQPSAPIPPRIVAATVAGNALEFYDFVTYAFFAVAIGKTFFPLSTELGSLLASVAVFGVGFVSRPLGGVLIGTFADRAGRKPALLLTIVLITFGTLGLALTPSYDAIGFAAPLIVVICRLVQGLALGGEVGPSSAFLIEAAPPAQRGRYASWQTTSQGVAILVAGLLGLGLTAWLSPAELLAWGWRLPFAVGLLLVPLAFYLRRSMPETLHAAPRVASNTGMMGLARQRRTIGLSVLLILGGTVATYVSGYMTTYATATLKLPPLIAMSATAMVGLMTVLFGLAGGWLSDRYGRKPVMLWPRLATVVLIVPGFALLIQQPSLGRLLAVTALLTALNAASAAATLTAIPELLPRGIRATGMAIAYAVGVALFGGSTQFIITWLIAATGNPAAPAWYVAGSGMITVLATLALPESRGRQLED